MYYKIEPEVAGGWGEGTEADTTCHPPKVNKLVYEFEGWFGDSIVTTFPCYLVIEELAESISHAKLSGYELANCEIAKSETFDELYQTKSCLIFCGLRLSVKQVLMILESAKI